jgi:hypothetical protein
MGRSCSVCAHPNRTAIEADDGVTRLVASRWGISQAAVVRHRAHMRTSPATASPSRATSTLPASTTSAPPPPLALDARTVALETLGALREKMKNVHPDKVTSVANAITHCAKLVAELSGETELTESQILRARPFRRLLDKLDEVLERHPAALAEWRAVLAREDG